MSFSKLDSLLVSLDDIARRIVDIIDKEPSRELRERYAADVIAEVEAFMSEVDRALKTPDPRDYENDQ